MLRLTIFHSGLQLNRQDSHNYLIILNLEDYASFHSILAFLTIILGICFEMHYDHDLFPLKGVYTQKISNNSNHNCFLME